jgi:hypothetical protein
MTRCRAVLCSAGLLALSACAQTLPLAEAEQKCFNRARNLERSGPTVSVGVGTGYGGFGWGGGDVFLGAGGFDNSGFGVGVAAQVPVQVDLEADYERCVRQNSGGQAPSRPLTAWPGF